MAKSKLNKKRALAWRMAATSVLLVAGVYLLVQHWHAVAASLNAARHARPLWAITSLLLMACTFCIAAAMYGVLALRPLRYSATLLVELAASFVNRLLPAGLGGLGLNGVYLYRRGHTPAQATAVVSVNNLLGMCAHVLLLAAVILFRPSALRALIAWHRPALSRGWIVIVAICLVAIVAMPAVRLRLARFGSNLLKSLRQETVSNIVRALLLAMSLTVGYTLLLFSAARSVDVCISLLQIFIVFSLGMLVGTATPTPGGLVGIEAGLFTGFVAYGVPDAQAGATVLVFRLASYWLPLLPGAVALLAARTRKLL